MNLPRPRPFRHVALLWTDDVAQPGDLIDRLIDVLRASQASVSLEAESAQGKAPPGVSVLTMAEICRCADLAVVIGNDRAVLRYARQLSLRGIPLVGINHSRMGFLTSHSPASAPAALAQVLAGDHVVEQRSMLQASVVRRGETVCEEQALNDIVIGHAQSTRLIELRLEVDGTHLTDVRADGLVVATATGSTAYCLSAGGPILHPGVAGWVVLPVAAHSLVHRPIVLPVQSAVRVTVLPPRAATVNADGHLAVQLEPGDTVELTLSARGASFVHPSGWSYIETLSTKLGWANGS